MPEPIDILEMSWLPREKFLLPSSFYLHPSAFILLPSSFCLSTLGFVGQLAFDLANVADPTADGSLFRIQLHIDFTREQLS